MPPLVPNRFLVRIKHTCPYVKKMPREDDDHLLDLPESARLNNYSQLDGQKNFADVRVAWNELGFGLQMQLKGKHNLPVGDNAKPWSSDGLTLWLDTRDARTSHRGSRYCHQFHFLIAGGGPEKDQPAFVQTKINRALLDAPLCNPADVAFHCSKIKSGYRIEAFIPATVLNGFDPEQHPCLGIYYHVRDGELGDQFLGVNGDFPVADDPSLWEPLDLLKG